MMTHQTIHTLEEHGMQGTLLNWQMKQMNTPHLCSLKQQEHTSSFMSAATFCTPASDLEVTRTLSPDLQINSLPTLWLLNITNHQPCRKVSLPAEICNPFGEAQPCSRDLHKLHAAYTDMP